jgi:hypothetical protein
MKTPFYTKIIIINYENENKLHYNSYVFATRDEINGFFFFFLGLRLQVFNGKN